jgi:hypothetical protein
MFSPSGNASSSSGKGFWNPGNGSAGATSSSSGKGFWSKGSSQAAATTAPQTTAPASSSSGKGFWNKGAAQSQPTGGGGNATIREGETIGGVEKGSHDFVRNRKAYMLKVLTEKSGLSAAAAAGVIGNLVGEGLTVADTGHLYSDPSSKHPDAKAGGIAGFNSYGGLPGLQRWASQNGLDWKTFTAQANYIATPGTEPGRVIEKIRQATTGLSDQEALRKAAVIWGHDYERFKGHDAADNSGNIVGKGAHNGRIYGNQNYEERINHGIGVFNTFTSGNLNYSGGTLGEQFVSAAGGMIDQSTGFVNSFKTADGGYNVAGFLEAIWNKIWGGGTQAVESGIEAGKEFIEDVKEGVESLLPDKPAKPTYHGNYSSEYSNYDEYKAFNGNLPTGLTEDQWRAEVKKRTGANPEEILPDSEAEIERMTEKLMRVEQITNKETQKVLSKYTAKPQTYTRADGVTIQKDESGKIVKAWDKDNNQIDIKTLELVDNMASLDGRSTEGMSFAEKANLLKASSGGKINVVGPEGEITSVDIEGKPEQAVAKAEEAEKAAEVTSVSEGTIEDVTSVMEPVMGKTKEEIARGSMLAGLFEEKKDRPKDVVEFLDVELMPKMDLLIRALGHGNELSALMNKSMAMNVDMTRNVSDAIFMTKPQPKAPTTIVNNSSMLQG